MTEIRCSWCDIDMIDEGTAYCYDCKSILRMIWAMDDILEEFMDRNVDFGDSRFDIAGGVISNMFIRAYENIDIMFKAGK